ncbi:hypothetical protein CSKR_100311 [Clonorchis sinensis]|uniref:Uncharacterized protein n=1 Tax=Clonorchis sinensis TaxID=79923 RepID=A0A419PDP8_CLOSI|nr:hypothetical protein CSKR_100311 [Clonorchis sinensis]
MLVSLSNHVNTAGQTPSQLTSLKPSFSFTNCFSEYTEIRNGLLPALESNAGLSSRQLMQAYEFVLMLKYGTDVIQYDDTACLADPRTVPTYLKLSNIQHIYADLLATTAYLVLNGAAIDGNLRGFEFRRHKHKPCGNTSMAKPFQDSRGALPELLLSTCSSNVVFRMTFPNYNLTS